MKISTLVSFRATAHRSILVMMLFFASKAGFAQIPLGSLSHFALFTAVGAVTNTGPGTAIAGDIGTNVGAISGYSGAAPGQPGNSTGGIYTADATTMQGAADVSAAYQSLLALTTTVPTIVPAMGGQTLTAGIYGFGGAASIGGVLTLDAKNDPKASFIFKIGGALSVGAASRVVLLNGASASRVFWQVNGAAAIGAQSTFAGVLIANGAIQLSDGVALQGQVLSIGGAISTYNTHISIPLVVPVPVLTPTPLPVPVPVPMQKMVCGRVTERGILTLTAPVGMVFTGVTFASYGTPKGSNGNYSLGGCHSTHSQSVVESYLLGKNTASIPATNEVFGDPCVGTTKCLAVCAVYAAPVAAPVAKVISGQVAEHETLTLTAPAGMVFTGVIFASYGTPTGSNGSYSLGGCHSLKSQSVVESYLLGKNTASIPATNEVFGDPCVDTFKSLAVRAIYAAPTVKGSHPPVSPQSARNPSLALSANEVILFPNPATARFTMQIPAVAGTAQFQAELLNTLGQVVRQQSAALPAEGGSLTVETAGLAEGVYTLRLHAGPTTITKRVVLH